MSAMSNQTTVVEQTIASVTQLNINAYCETATIALILYEYWITFPDEINLVWDTGNTVVTIIFFVNRYLLVSYGIVIALNLIPLDTPLSCESMYVLLLVQGTAIGALVAVFSALRMYAISGHKLMFTLLVLLLGSAPLVINLYADASLSYAYVVPLNGLPLCSWRSSSQDLHQRLLILACACSVVSDLIVLVTTWLRTFNVVREVGLFEPSASTGRLVLRDGSAYFIVMAILGVMEVTIENLNTNAQIDWPYLGFLRLSLSSILISRFILSLRRTTSNARNDSSQIAPEPYGINSHGTRLIEEMSSDLHSDSFGGFSTVIVFDDWGNEDDVLGIDEKEEDARSRP